MQNAFKLLVILFYVLNADLIPTAAAVDAAAEELSNDVINVEEVVPDSTNLLSEEIKSKSTTTETRDNDIAVKNDDSDDDEAENLSLEEQYENAVEFYLNNNWQSCIDGFETAIKSFQAYKRKLIGCRRKCRAEANAGKPIFAEDIEDIHFYEKKLKETLCLMKCKKIKISEDIKGKVVPIDVEIKFIERRPYDYLHICYYQMKRYQDAANAMFTFLVFHHNHVQSRKNLQFYIDLPDVVAEEVIDKEAHPFLSMYRAGLDAHYDENWPEVIEQLENSINAFMEAEDDCRLYCEGPFDQGWLPEFTMSIANHFTFALKCKRSCSRWLNNVNGEQRNDLLTDHYHYLQFAYSQLGKLKEACAAVESFLLFKPTDDTVLQNKQYFSKLPEVKKEYFEPREEASSYVKREQYELRLMHYIQEEFKKFAQPIKK